MKIILYSLIWEAWEAVSSPQPDLGECTDEDIILIPFRPLLPTLDW